MKKTIKKTLLTLFAVITMTVIFCFGASALSETGQCGDNVYWDYNSSTGELVISGSGAMTNYSYYGSPFWNSDIKSVVIKDSVTTIGSYAFESCDSLQSVTIPDSVTTIGDLAFAYCTGLQSITIPDSVTTIGEHAFDDCGSLQSITIPDSVTTIGSGAFAYCYSITVDKDNKYYCNDEYGVLFDKNKTKLIQYPVGNKRTAYTIPDSVTAICDYAFCGCNSLQSITIPDSVTTIGDQAFAFCNSLQSVTIGGSVTTIGDGAFESCDSLQSITIPDSVTTIADYAFRGCESLNNVYYKGTKAQWKKIYIGSGNYTLTSATIHYNYHKHTYTTTLTKATLTKNGNKVSKCTVCGTKKTTIIYYPKTLTLSTAKYIYDGKNKTPKVTIKDANGKALTKGTDYKLTVASKRSAIGRYTVKVTFMGNYSGTKNLYFYVLPGKPSTVKSASLTTSAIKLTWSKVSGAAGYTVYRYSPSRKEYVKAGATTGTSYTVKNLLEGTKYTFRVVAYGKTSSGKVYNSNTYALIKTATCTKTPTLKLASTAKGRATVAWTNVNGETGYQVYYATSKNGTYSRVANYKADTAKIYKTGLTSGKTYYFKVRTYIKTDSGYVYSPFSAVKSVKVK